MKKASTSKYGITIPMIIAINKLLNILKVFNFSFQTMLNINQIKKMSTFLDKLQGMKNKFNY